MNKIVLFILCLITIGIAIAPLVLIIMHLKPTCTMNGADCGASLSRDECPYNSELRWDFSYGSGFAFMTGTVITCAWKDRDIIVGFISQAFAILFVLIFSFRACCCKGGKGSMFRIIMGILATMILEVSFVLMIVDSLPDADTTDAILALLGASSNHDIFLITAGLVILTSLFVLGLTIYEITVRGRSKSGNGPTINHHVINNTYAASPSPYGHSVQMSAAPHS